MTHIAHANDVESEFRCTGIYADVRSTQHARAEFDQWLRARLAESTIPAADVRVAIHEALVNAAEHAYFGAARTGTVDVSASYDAAADQLLVTVRDHGQWRRSDPLDADAGHRRHRRGRGIQMMRLMADDTSIEATASGTRVKLAWRTRPLW